MTSHRSREDRQIHTICALLRGHAKTTEEADRTAKRYSNCPYVRLMATKRRQLFATFFLPESQRWWIEYVKKNPQETFKLETVKVTCVDNVYHPRVPEIRLQKKLLTVAPCGSNCEKCPSYERCSGCPATVFYKGAKCGSSISL